MRHNERDHEQYDVPSFTNPKLTYKATPAGGCKCPRGEIKGDCIKHPFFAAQLAFVRSHSFIRATKNDEEVLLELVAALFANEKKETPGQALRLYEACCQFQFSNEALRKVARTRMKRILCANENKGKAA